MIELLKVYIRFIYLKKLFFLVPSSELLIFLGLFSYMIFTKNEMNDTVTFIKLKINGSAKYGKMLSSLPDLENMKIGLFLR